MCGIYGCITKRDFSLTKHEKEERNSIIRGLGLAMEKRGSHSAGIAGINEKSFSIYKKAVPSHELLQHKEYEKLLNNHYNIVMGHTRWATVGNIVDDNSHPFKFGNIIGIHNGSVYNFKSINSDLKVDSEAIFYLLNKNKNDFKKTFPELYGSFAIAWFNKKEPHKIRLVAEGNPIHIIYIHAIRTYFFASEEYPLEAVVGSYFEINKKSNVWQPEDGKVYTIDTNLQVKKEIVSFKKYYSTSNGQGVYRPRYYDAEEYENENEYWENWGIEHGYINSKDPNTKKTIDTSKYKSYEDRYETKNPFAVIRDDKDAVVLEDVHDLEYETMQLIVRAVESNGCASCNRTINIEGDEGCYYYELHDIKITICIRCVDEDKFEFEYLLWVEPEEYSSMLEEVHMFEDRENKKGKGEAIPLN